MSNNTSQSFQLATLCYLIKEDQVLMINKNKKDNKHLGKWNGLGGKLELSESPREGVIREVYEESGLTIFYPKFHGVLTFPNFSDNKDWVVFVYSARDFDGTLIANSEEGEISWIKKEQLFLLPLWPSDFYFLPHVLNEKLFEGKFEYKDGTLLSHEVTIY